MWRPPYFATNPYLVSVYVFIHQICPTHELSVLFCEQGVLYCGLLIFYFWVPSTSSTGKTVCKVLQQWWLSCHLMLQWEYRLHCFNFHSGTFEGFLQYNLIIKENFKRLNRWRVSVLRKQCCGKKGWIGLMSYGVQLWFCWGTLSVCCFGGRSFCFLSSSGILLDLPIHFWVASAISAIVIRYLPLRLSYHPSSILIWCGIWLCWLYRCVVYIFSIFHCC